MRFVLVAVIWLVLAGGLFFYIHQREEGHMHQIAAAVAEEVSGEDLALEITPNFSTSGDPFALQGDPGATATLLVRAGGREVYRSDRPLPANITQSVRPVQGLVAGMNELYVRAVPPAGESGQDHAVRVRLLQGGRVVVDQTLLGPQGAVVAGTIPVTLTAGKEGNHGH